MRLEFTTDVKPLEDDARRQALYANLAFGAAGVSAIVTAVLFYTSGDSYEDSGDKEPGTVVGPMVESDAVGVSAMFRF